MSDVGQFKTVFSASGNLDSHVGRTQKRMDRLKKDTRDARKEVSGLGEALKGIGRGVGGVTGSGGMGQMFGGGFGKGAMMVGGGMLIGEAIQSAFRLVTSELSQFFARQREWNKGILQAVGKTDVFQGGNVPESFKRTIGARGRFSADITNQFMESAVGFNSALSMDKKGLSRAVGLSEQLRASGFRGSNVGAAAAAAQSMGGTNDAGEAVRLMNFFPGSKMSTISDRKTQDIIAARARSMGVDQYDLLQGIGHLWNKEGYDFNRSLARVRKGDIDAAKAVTFDTGGTLAAGQSTSAIELAEGAFETSKRNDRRMYSMQDVASTLRQLMENNGVDAKTGEKFDLKRLQDTFTALQAGELMTTDNSMVDMSALNTSMRGRISTIKAWAGIESPMPGGPDDYQRMMNTEQTVKSYGRDASAELAPILRDIATFLKGIDNDRTASGRSKNAKVSD
jgi:hypothetical protein